MTTRQSDPEISFNFEDMFKESIKVESRKRELAKEAEIAFKDALGADFDEKYDTVVLPGEERRILEIGRYKIIWSPHTNHMIFTSSAFLANIGTPKRSIKI